MRHLFRVAESVRIQAPQQEKDLKALQKYRFKPHDVFQNRPGEPSMLQQYLAQAPGDPTKMKEWRRERGFPRRSPFGNDLDLAGVEGYEKVTAEGSRADDARRAGWQLKEKRKRELADL